jgi:predicted MPP superfamily phosphohydrolase
VLTFKLTRRRFLALMGAAALGLAADASLIEPYLALEVSHLELHVGVRRALRVLQVTDLHFGNSLLPLIYEAALSAAQSAHPDLVAVTGDLISKAEGVEAAISFTAQLSSLAPTYVVPGNWEYWSLGGRAEVEGFLKALEGAGNVKALVNEAVEVGEVNLLGVDDPYLGLDELDEALQGCRGGVKVLLAHSPQIIEKARGRVDVVLAGHTHGGQLHIPLIGPLFVPLPSKYRRYVAGLFEEDGTYMYVCRGVGMSLAPLRFMCRPEVAVVDLRP